MTIPDPLVYAAIPVVAGATVKVSQWLIQDVMRKPEAPPVVMPVEMTMVDFGKISEMMKRELNGRYMFATEARAIAEKTDAKIAALEHKMDHQDKELRTFIRTEIAAALKPKSA